MILSEHKYAVYSTPCIDDFVLDDVPAEIQDKWFNREPDQYIGFDEDCVNEFSNNALEITNDFQHNLQVYYEVYNKDMDCYAILPDRVLQYYPNPMKLDSRVFDALTQKEISNIEHHIDMCLTDSIKRHAAIDTDEHPIDFIVHRLLTGYEEALEELMVKEEALRMAEKQFEYYATSHAKKGNADKASTNKQMAEHCRVAIEYKAV